MGCISIDVDIDDIIGDIDDDFLVYELEQRGYTVDKRLEIKSFDREDYDYIIEILDKQPVSWYTHRIRDKLFQARHREKL